MSLIVKFQKPLLFSSSSDSATVVNNGAEFSIRLNDEIKFPENTVQISLYLDRLVTYNTYPNIIEPNNKFYIDDNGAPYVVTIPKGLYSVTSLNSTISRELAALGADPNLVKLTGDSSRQIVIIQFLKVGVQIDFTPADSIREILGFNARLSPAGAPSAAVNETDEADSVAQFNQIEYLLLECPGLVSTGYAFNQDKTSNIIGQIPITVSPGKQIVFESGNNPDRVDLTDSITAEIGEVTFRLVDQNRVPIDTNGEFYSVKLMLEYSVSI